MNLVAEAFAHALAKKVAPVASKAQPAVIVYQKPSDLPILSKGETFEGRLECNACHLNEITDFLVFKEFVVEKADFEIVDGITGTIVVDVRLKRALC